MAQVFHRSANTLARFSILAGLTLAALFTVAAYFVEGSTYTTYELQPIGQRVAFSHQHHASGLGLDCRFCHSTVEQSAFAGMPSTETCMTCHSQIWRESPMLEPVRASFATHAGLDWQRVYDLPNYVYFNHSIHVNKGVGCSSCHGRVDQMPLTWKANPMTMSWCLECHREPEKNLRPRSEVFNMAWQPGTNQHAAGKQLETEFQLNRNLMTDCSTCHR